MNATLFPKTLSLAAAAVALLWSAASVAAFDRPPLPAASECVTACMQASRDCEAPVRDALHACIDEAGCDALIDAAKAACEADRESDECEAARSAVHDCVAPCRDAAKEGLAACRSTALSCLRDDCGLADLPNQCGRPPRGF